MKLCLTCRALAPSSASYCPDCGRSFGGRRCPKGHLSPAGSACCVRCGKTEGLSEPARYMDLSWLARSLTWVVVLLGLRWILAHLDTVACAGVRATIWGVAWLLSTTPKALACAVCCVVRWLLVLGLVLALVPGEAGKSLRAFTGRTVRLGWKLTILVLRVLVRVLLRLVEGGKAADGDAKKDAK